MLLHTVRIATGSPGLPGSPQAVRRSCSTRRLSWVIAVVHSSICPRSQLIYALPDRDDRGLCGGVRPISGWSCVVSFERRSSAVSRYSQRDPRSFTSNCARADSFANAAMLAGGVAACCCGGLCRSAS